jgi:outer membrane protein TolC
MDDASIEYTLTENFVVPVADYALPNLRDRMLANNYNLQNLQLNRELANVGTKIQESTKSPTLALSSGLSYNWNLQSGSGTTSDGETREIDALIGKTFNYSLGFTFSYNLFDGGVRKRNIQNAQLNEMGIQYGIEDFKRSLNTQLKNTLGTFQNQQQVVQLTEDLLENARENLAIAKERFEGGLISSFDYRTIQLNFINASQTKLNAIFNLKNTETELIRLIGGLVR